MNAILFREFKRIRQNMLIPAEEAVQWARMSLHFNRRHGIK